MIILPPGDGAYSEVYKVRRNSDNKIYALKKVRSKSGSANLMIVGQNGKIECQRKGERAERSANPSILPVSDGNIINTHNSVCLFVSLLSRRHGSIVGYKEAFFEDSTSCLCIVMEFLDDGDLY